MKTIAAIGMLLMLAACGRAEPNGSFFDPVCMPDGSVSFFQPANASGGYDEPRAKKEYCSWNKPAAAK